METNDSDNKPARKFGLPNWMVNNIERLNFVTDFEQYACSPPETEGFLSEHIDNRDTHEFAQIDSQSVQTPDAEGQKVLNYTESRDIPQRSENLLSKAVEKVYHKSVLENLKHEEVCSSPDTTPCPTPEPSPAPRRRMSGQQDAVHTNPGRWFYLGNLKKLDPNNKEHGLNLNNKENRKKLDKNSDGSPKKRESPVKQKDSIRLVISNFDINAISPTSW